MLSLGAVMSDAPTAVNAVHNVEQPTAVFVGLTAAWETAVAGKALELTVLVKTEEPASALRVRLTGQGVVGDPRIDRVLEGPFAPGVETSFVVMVPTGWAGMGRLSALAEVLDEDGRTRAADDATLDVLFDSGRIWHSNAGQVELRVDRLRNLFESGSIDALAYWSGLAEVTGGVVSTSAVLGQTASVAAVAATTYTISGTIQWTDVSGGLHAAPLVTVEIRDSDLIGSELVTTVTTDMSGKYTASFNHSDGIGAGDPDFFIRVFARSTLADVSPDSLFGSTYSIDSKVFDETAPGSHAIDVIAGNVNDNERAFSVHTALVVIAGYAGSLTGSTPSKINVAFPTDGSFFNGGLLGLGRKIAIRGGAAYEWDEIHHEYGHYVASIHGFDRSRGGKHSVNENLATRNGKDNGNTLAWSEGWATFFAISGQLSTTVPTLGNLAAVGYGDSSYSAYAGALVVNLESPTMLGEDNEETVMATLWDIWDSANEGADRSMLTDRTIFSTLRSAAVGTLGEAWEAFAAAKDTKGKTELGGLFAQNNVAPSLQAPSDNATFRAADPLPEFKWKRNGGGVPNPLDDFVIKFYSSDFGKVLFEENITSSSSTATFTPTDITYKPKPEDWSKILGEAGEVKWVVEGKNTASPETPGGSLDRYWSKAQTIGGVNIVFVIDDTGSMSEEIAGMRVALQNFINEVESKLTPGATPPTIQLITFKDGVTTRITSNNLSAIRTAVAALRASGGGDCPEASGQALEVASKTIAPGGTILLATDASSQPGVNVSAVIADLKTKGVTVNVILSGDCEGIDSSGGPPGPSSSAASASPVSGRAATVAVAAGTMDASAASASVPMVALGVGLQAPSPFPGGSDEPPREKIDDPGQAPIDLVGDTFDTAGRLTIGGSPIIGLIGLDLDGADVYAVDLHKDVRYAIRPLLDDGPGYTLEVFAPDKTTRIGNRFVVGASLSRDDLVVTPTVDGDHYVRISRVVGTSATRYHVSVIADPLAGVTSAVKLFSTVAAQTGGAFFVHEEVNAGQPTAYVAALFNVMVSTLGPAILSANPAAVPQGQTLSITLTGRGTNWRAGVTNVLFPDGGVTVRAVEVRSATSLSVLIEIADNALLGFQDVIATTPLGAVVETVSGRDVLQVGLPITGPQILSVESNVLSQNTTATVLVRGANTEWDATSTVTLGPGVRVDSVTVESQTLIRVALTIDANANIGYRTVRVETNGKESQDQQRALFIVSGASIVPEIIGLSPTAGRRGREVEVAVTGLNTSFVAGVTTATFGEGIEVRGVTITGPTGAIIRVFVTPDAALGFRTVVLTTGAEAVLLASAFRVDADIIENGPQVIEVHRDGVHWEPTRLQITFDKPLDPIRASNTANYQIVAVGKLGRRMIVRVRKALYNEGENTVVLEPARRLRYFQRHEIRIVGSTSQGLTDNSGRLLDGDGDGTPGGDFRAAFARRGLVGRPVSLKAAPQPRVIVMRATIASRHPRMFFRGR